MLNTKKISIFSSIIMSSTFASAGDAIYTVKSGETLSEILYSHKLKPVYGQNGALIKILELNNELIDSNGNKIYPGMKLNLDISRANGKKYNLTDNRQQTTDNRQQTTDNRQQTTDNRQQTTDNRQQTIINHEVRLGDSDVEIKPESVSPFLPSYKPAQKIIQDTSPKKRSPSDNLNQHRIWQVGAELSWKNLSTTESISTRDSNIQSMSSMCYGLNGTYGYHLSDGLNVYSTLSLDYSVFNDDNSINLSKRKVLLKDFDFGVDLFKNYSVSLGYAERMYLSSQALSTIDIKTVNIPNTKFSYHKNLWELGFGRIDGELGTRILFPSSGGSLKTNLSAGFNTKFKFAFNDEAFVVGYEYLPLKSSTNQTNIQNIFWNFVIGNSKE